MVCLKFEPQPLFFFLKKYFYVIELHWNTWKKRDQEYTSIKINK